MSDMNLIHPVFTVSEGNCYFSAKRTETAEPKNTKYVSLLAILDVFIG